MKKNFLIMYFWGLFFPILSFSLNYNMPLSVPLINSNNFYFKRQEVDKEKTNFILAVQNNDLDLLKKLEKKGVKVNKSPILNKNLLSTAVYYQAQDTSNYFIKTDNKQVNEISSDTTLAIQNAVLKENAEILKTLLDNGANIRQKDGRGKDIYDLATRFGKGRMVKILRDKELEKFRKSNKK